MYISLLGPQKMFNHCKNVLSNKPPCMDLKCMPLQSESQALETTTYPRKPKRTTYQSMYDRSGYHIR